MIDYTFGGNCKHQYMRRSFPFSIQNKITKSVKNLFRAKVIIMFIV